VSAAPLRVAVLGAGTVGREVVRAFEAFPERLAVDGGPRLELAGVAVRDLARARASGIERDLLTDAPAHLVADPATDVVVEVMGGDEPARTLIAAALGGGKAVVTANKHVIAHHGPELEATARRARAALRFEASVGGGIPVLGPLAALGADRVERVRGIVNGSTNHLLTEMARGGRSYDDALAEAQAAGYLEADPSADIDGIDAANKLTILIRLAFGTWVDPDAIVRRPPTVGDGEPDWAGTAGIGGIRAVDIAGAAALGLAIKLVADARRIGEERIAASVVPTAVPLADPLGRTNGVTNRIEVRASPLGGIAFSGPGAGGGATASAVLTDLLAIARDAGSTWAGLAPASSAATGRLAGPPEEAPDRGWFAVLPADKAPEALAGSGADAAVVDGGLAVRLTRAPLSDARRLFARAGAAADTPILPVDESGSGNSG
jgi:homoserine dehydrogenase